MRDYVLYILGALREFAHAYIQAVQLPVGEVPTWVLAISVVICMHAVLEARVQIVRMSKAANGLCRSLQKLMVPLTAEAYRLMVRLFISLCTSIRSAWTMIRADIKKSV